MKDLVKVNDDPKQYVEDCDTGEGGNTPSKSKHFSPLT